ncbi:small integral membrane protein 24 isoform X1 [Strigops habroptila]|uniref:small integral membrane protein 24 isoform X1 n=1 Tax=Strigops habroptila TaxID=2489341 RepID=UPI0011CF70B0|nr:small integral membrane protein 24 isoform X1 [Strigops habroptila]
MLSWGQALAPRSCSPGLSASRLSLSSSSSSSSSCSSTGSGSSGCTGSRAASRTAHGPTGWSAPAAPTRRLRRAATRRATAKGGRMPRRCKPRPAPGPPRRASRPQPSPRGGNPRRVLRVRPRGGRCRGAAPAAATIRRGSTAAGGVDPGGQRRDPPHPCIWLVPPWREGVEPQ